MAPIKHDTPNGEVWFRDPDTVTIEDLLAAYQARHEIWTEADEQELEATGARNPVNDMRRVARGQIAFMAAMLHDDSPLTAEQLPGSVPSRDYRSWVDGLIEAYTAHPTQGHTVPSKRASTKRTSGKPSSDS